MKVAVIVQARMTSKRLPGKILELIDGKAVLQHCLDRCQEIKGVDSWVLAIPNDDNANKIKDNISLGKFTVSLGPEKDVLNRYIKAQKEVDADLTIRITADCPVIDPQICSEMLTLFKANNLDYIANGEPRTFPHGFDCEIFKSELLEKLPVDSLNEYSREHVTPNLKFQNLVKYNYSTSDLNADYDYSSLRLVVDTYTDLSRLRTYFESSKSLCRLDEFSFQTLLSLNDEWQSYFPSTPL